MTTGEAARGWFWCTRHNRAEEADEACPPDDRLGPYESKEAAEHWRERAEARNERWEEQDREWSGEDGQ
ncbi:MAG: hypothetical protein M3N68_00940 [Actinomycetota bacterium]|nr:hypothetical protein [Actinomycetota bacterium]